MSCVGGSVDRWGSLGSLGSWSVLGSWGAIWGAEANFGVKKVRFGVRVRFYGGFLGGFGPLVELRWGLWRSLGFFGFFGVLGVFWGAEANFGVKKMNFGV